MAENSQDLVVRLKANSHNFNEGIDKAKGKLDDFKKSGKKSMDGFSSAIGMASKAFAALGIAIGAKNMFTSFMNSTESMHDLWNNEIGAMKDTWKGFLFQINTSNFSGLNDLIQNARAARQELDALGDSMALTGLHESKYRAQMEDLLATIGKKKKSGQDYSAEVAQYESLVELLSSDYQRDNAKAQKSIEYLFKNKLGPNFNPIEYGTTWEGMMDIARGVASGDLYAKEVDRYRKAYNSRKPDISELNDFDIEVPDYNDNALTKLEKEWGTQKFNMIKLFSDLGDIPTAEKEQIEGLQNKIYQNGYTVANLRKRLNRYLETENNTNTKLVVEAEKHGMEGLVPELTPKKYEGEIQFTPNAAKPLDEDWLNNAMAQYEYEQLIIEETKEKEAALWKERIENLNAYASALGNVSQIFQNLGSMASDDSPWKKLMNILGSVANGIMSLVQTYTSLVAVESVAQAIESGKGIPFPYNLVAMASAGAVITSLIATIAAQANSQHFAQGGIVGGNDYHDGIHANLSTGEMVLNKNQQTRLWGLIMSGGNGQKTENVVFKISGEDLVGVIDNYNKNSNY